MNAMTRHDFEIGPGTQSHTDLRKLAKTIAEYDCLQARQACFFSAKPPPYNFLANGETTNYVPLSPVPCPLQVAYWKFGGASPLNCCLERGFNDGSAAPSCLGMSLLFDPLIDGVLAANANCLHTPVAMPQRHSTIIVLSDYGPAWDPAIKLVGFSGKDWGQEEAENVIWPPTIGGQINRNQVSATLVNLWNCLVESEEWQTDQRLTEKPSKIADAIRTKNILVWNFMPFLRGGYESSGASGLPQNMGWWRATCWQWLRSFAFAVDASQVVFAMNKANIIDLRNSAAVRNHTPDKKFEPAEIEDYFKKFAKETKCSADDASASVTCPTYEPLVNAAGLRIPVFQINHPASWIGKGGKSRSHCQELRQILSLRTS